MKDLRELKSLGMDSGSETGEATPNAAHAKTSKLLNRPTSSDSVHSVPNNVVSKPTTGPCYPTQLNICGVVLDPKMLMFEDVLT